MPVAGQVVCVESSKGAAGRPLRPKEACSARVRKPDIISRVFPVDARKSERTASNESAVAGASAQVFWISQEKALDTLQWVHDAPLRAQHFDGVREVGVGTGNNALDPQRILQKREIHRQETRVRLR